MVIRDIEAFDEYRKKGFRELLEKGERLTVVAGFTDYFGDGELALCSDCATPVLLRPWIFEAIEKYDLRVICIRCVKPQTLKDQLRTDLTKYEENR